MRSWPVPEIPVLPGIGLPVRLYDTSSETVRVVGSASTASMYVCGITPYDATHLGHAATYLAFDLLNRAWRDSGHEVSYVQNVTDIDDPLLERAAQTGQDWRELAAAQTQLFTEDMAWLRVLPPAHYLGAVESIPLVIELISRLREASAVYEIGGDVYFSVRSDPRFGEIARLDDATMRSLFAERGGDPDRECKKDQLDCLLWQAARPGEPSWDSPFGPGRPGWHVECAAIALHYLESPFDVQGGGSDLAFPHHEMSAAHAHVATGRWPFAYTYAHAGMVGLDGQKMSKSLGNLVFASQLRHAGHEAAAVRLALLSAHYRADREWRPSVLAEAEQRLARWRKAALVEATPDVLPLLAAVREHLANDLDTPAALAAVDAWVSEALSSGGAAASSIDHPPGLFRSVTDALLGISL